jgi:hypothetical protein
MSFGLVDGEVADIVVNGCGSAEGVIDFTIWVEADC